MSCKDHKEEPSRLAVVGLGSIGRRHLRLLKNSYPDSKIIVMRSGNGLACAEQDLADKVVFNIDDLISENISAAIISTPASLHVEQAQMLIKNGVHLLIEKPLSINSECLKALQVEAEKKNCVVQVGYVLRYKKSLIRFKNMVESGMLGKIEFVNVSCQSYLPNWRPDSDYTKGVSANKKLGGGVLLEVSHEIDYVQWIFGPFYKLNAQVKNTGLLDIDVDDVADIYLGSKDDFIASVHLSFSSNISSREILCVGERGQILLNLLTGSITGQVYGVEINENYTEDRDVAYENQINDFFGKINILNTNNDSLRDGINVMKIIDSARISSSLNRKEYL